MKKILMCFLFFLATYSASFAQKVYLGWTLRPFVSFNTLGLNKNFVTSEFNWRVYRIDDKVQKSIGGSSAIGPTLTLDLFRLNLSASSLLSFRTYKFEGKRLLWATRYETEESYLGELLIEFPVIAGVTLFSGKPLKLYIEGGLNFNAIIQQSEDEPLLAGGDIYLPYLLLDKSYRDLVVGAGLRYKNMFFTIRRYDRIDSPDAISSLHFWTFNFQINMKSNKYSKHIINL